jgi:hypothetical protein
MVAQVVIRGRPILRDTPFAKQADGDIAMPGTRKRTIERLQDARETRSAGFGWIEMLAQLSMFCQI